MIKDILKCQRCSLCHTHDSELLTMDLNDYKSLYQYQKKLNYRLVMNGLKSLTKTEIVDFLKQKKVLTDSYDGDKLIHNFKVVPRDFIW